MKASCYNWDIEDGRIMALEDTEVQYIIELDYNSLGEEDKNIVNKSLEKNKERLHKQALFVADITLKYLENGK